MPAMPNWFAALLEISSSAGYPMGNLVMPMLPCAAQLVLSVGKEHAH